RVALMLIPERAKALTGICRALRPGGKLAAVVLATDAECPFLATRHVLYQALRQVADLGAGIGDDLLALAVIELLRHLKRLGSRPTEARTAKFLQRRQIVQLGWSLPLFLDAHAKRALEAPSRIDDVLGNLAPDNPL